MSGDVQPRKRKDKKKRKEDGDPIPEKPHVPVFSNNTLNNEDVNIHVHKEGGTGGGICAKLVFFILFSALAVLIGLIITEHRGLTDLETIDPNSKFSQLFEGWVDTNSHDDHDDHDIEAFEDDDHDDDHEDDHDDDEHDGDHEDEDYHDEQDDDHDEHDEETEEVEHSQEDEDDQDEDQLEEPIEDEEDDDDDDEPDDQNDEIDDVDNDDEIEEDDDDDVNTQEDETVEETKEEEEEDDDVAASQEDDIEQDDQDDENDNEQLSNEDEVDDQNTEEQDEQDDQDDQAQDVEDDIEVSREKRDISDEKVDEDDTNDIDDDDKDQDNDEIDDDDDAADEDDQIKDQESGEKEEDKDENQASDEKDDDVDDDAKQEDEEQVENKKIVKEQVKPKSKEVKTEKQNEEKAEESALGGAGTKELPEPRDSDSDRQSDDNEDYEYTNITNKDDHSIRQEIDEAQSAIKNNTSHAIALFDKILQKFPSSPRSLYGKALALDLLADKKRSNEILEKSLQLYVKLLKTDDVPEPLFLQAADRCIDRMRFLGKYKNAIMVHNIIIDKFPKNPKHLNSLAVTYLTIHRIEEARTVLKQILTKWPDDGFALVHYGFILKTFDNDLEKSVRYLTKGIRTKDEGVIDGRFYFHLGDALVRLGRHKEAEEVYEEGTINKVFLSKYQRSLYNVPRLSGKPWWKVEELPYTKSLKLLAASWKKIREEGLSILSEKGYFQDESENLRDTGEWKQFELYARGQKNVNNCKKCPFTCNIISQIQEARGCTRGQTKFSVMHPGTHIWPHCGPTNCRLRVHLGLKVPPNTFIRVAKETKSWKEGEIFIFDDSFEHEVWHNGTDFRLILIVDIWHPELKPSERINLSPI